MNNQSTLKSHLIGCVLLSVCGSASVQSESPEVPAMENTVQELSNVEKAVALLESLETGAQEPAGYINAESYTQHNLAVGDGIEGFAEVLAHQPPEGFKARVVRAFADGDFVFTHTEYDFFGPKVGFDIFRFEDGLIVEHWDNLATITPPNPSGRSQLDGPTAVEDADQSEANKELVRRFVDTILVRGDMTQLAGFFDGDNYIQHNSAVADGLSGLGVALEAMAAQGVTMEYDTIHMVLGQGNFVLVVSEGRFAGNHSAYYDLFRVENGKIAEHWDVIETIPPRSEWANQNTKF